MECDLFPGLTTSPELENMQHESGFESESSSLGEPPTEVASTSAEILQLLGLGVDMREVFGNIHASNFIYENSSIAGSSSELSDIFEDHVDENDQGIHKLDDIVKRSFESCLKSTPRKDRKVTSNRHVPQSKHRGKRRLQKEATFLGSNNKRSNTDTKRRRIDNPIPQTCGNDLSNIDAHSEECNTGNMHVDLWCRKCNLIFANEHQVYRHMTSHRLKVKHNIRCYRNESHVQRCATRVYSPCKFPNKLHNRTEQDLNSDSNVSFTTRVDSSVKYTRTVQNGEHINETSNGETKLDQCIENCRSLSKETSSNHFKLTVCDVNSGGHESYENMVSAENACHSSKETTSKHFKDTVCDINSGGHESYENLVSAENACHSSKETLSKHFKGTVCDVNSGGHESYENLVSAKNACHSSKETTSKHFKGTVCDVNSGDHESYENMVSAENVCHSSKETTSKHFKGTVCDVNSGDHESYENLVSAENAEEYLKCSSNDTFTLLKEENNKSRWRTLVVKGVDRFSCDQHMSISEHENCSRTLPLRAVVSFVKVTIDSHKQSALDLRSTKKDQPKDEFSAIPVFPSVKMLNSRYSKCQISDCNMDLTSPSISTSASKSSAFETPIGTTVRSKVEKMNENVVPAIIKRKLIYDNGDTVIEVAQPQSSQLKSTPVSSQIGEVNQMETDQIEHNNGSGEYGKRLPINESICQGFPEITDPSGSNGFCTSNQQCDVSKHSRITGEDVCEIGTESKTEMYCSRTLPLRCLVKTLKNTNNTSQINQVSNFVGHCSFINSISNSTSENFVNTESDNMEVSEFESILLSPKSRDTDNDTLTANNCEENGWKQGQHQNSKGEHHVGHQENSKGEHHVGHQENSKGEHHVGHQENSKGEHHVGHQENSSVLIHNDSVKDENAATDSQHFVTDQQDSMQVGSNSDEGDSKTLAHKKENRFINIADENCSFNVRIVSRDSIPDDARGSNCQGKGECQRKEDSSGLECEEDVSHMTNYCAFKDEIFSTFKSDDSKLDGTMLSQNVYNGIGNEICMVKSVFDSCAKNCVILEETSSLCSIHHTKDELHYGQSENISTEEDELHNGQSVTISTEQDELHYGQSVTISTEEEVTKIETCSSKPKCVSAMVAERLHLQSNSSCEFLEKHTEVLDAGGSAEDQCNKVIKQGKICNVNKHNIETAAQAPCEDSEFKSVQHPKSDVTHSHYCVKSSCARFLDYRSVMLRKSQQPSSSPSKENIDSHCVQSDGFVKSNEQSSDVKEQQTLVTNKTHTIENGSPEKLDTLWKSSFDEDIDTSEAKMDLTNSCARFISIEDYKAAKSSSRDNFQNDNQDSQNSFSRLQHKRSPRSTSNSKATILKFFSNEVLQKSVQDIMESLQRMYSVSGTNRNKEQQSVAKERSVEKDQGSDLPDSLPSGEAKCLVTLTCTTESQTVSSADETENDYITYEVHAESGSEYSYDERASEYSFRSRDLSNHSSASEKSAMGEAVAAASRKYDSSDTSGNHGNKTFVTDVKDSESDNALLNRTRGSSAPFHSNIDCEIENIQQKSPEKEMLNEENPTNELSSFPLKKVCESFPVDVYAKREQNVASLNIEAKEVLSKSIEQTEHTRCPIFYSSERYSQTGTMEIDSIDAVKTSVNQDSYCVPPAMCESKDDLPKKKEIFESAKNVDSSVHLTKLSTPTTEIDIKYFENDFDKGKTYPSSPTSSSSSCSSSDTESSASDMHSSCARTALLQHGASNSQPSICGRVVKSNHIRECSKKEFCSRTSIFDVKHRH